jgi:hypothetical protein
LLNIQLDNQTYRALNKVAPPGATETNRIHPESSQGCDSARRVSKDSTRLRAG